MPKKKPTKGKPTVHKDLEGFEVNINEFGELTSNTKVEDLNKFLNKNVDDKKLRDRDDLKEEWENETEEVTSFDDDDYDDDDDFDDDDFDDDDFDDDDFDDDDFDDDDLEDFEDDDDEYQE